MIGSRSAIDSTCVAFGSFLGDLSVEVDQIAGKEAMEQLYVLQNVRLGDSGDQIGVAGDRHLGFNEQQVSFGRPIDLALLGTCVPGVSVGNVFSDPDGGEHHSIGQRLSFPAGRRAESAGKGACKSDTFLPDFEVAKGGCHAANMAAERDRTGTE